MSDEEYDEEYWAEFERDGEIVLNFTEVAIRGWGPLGFIFELARYWLGKGGELEDLTKFEETISERLTLLALESDHEEAPGL